MSGPLLCRFCGVAPPIQNSHIAPKFLGHYIKANSPFGNMLNTWLRKPQLDLHTGPYLCTKCDNELFSQWEGFFARHVWRDPVSAHAPWTDARSICFALSLAYRYAIHFVETSPILVHKPYSMMWRDLTHQALKDHSLVKSKVYIYPYVYRPIQETCSLLPGVNHLLNLAVHAENLPQEGDLPNAFLIVIPKILFLFCDRPLSDSKDNEIASPESLGINGSFNATVANVEMPLFISTILNRLIGQGQAHQKALGRWKGMAFQADKLLNPTKACYVAQQRDRSLDKWQLSNCLRR